MNGQSEARPGPSLFRWALWGVAAFGVAAVVYIIGQASTNPDASRGMRAFAKGEMAALQTPKDPRPAPVTTIYDPEGQPVRLGDFRGEVVVLNLWRNISPSPIERLPLALCDRRTVRTAELRPQPLPRYDGRTTAGHEILT